MHVIHARNVNDALTRGLDYLKEHGVEEDSRNGRVLRSVPPVATVYAAPRERVLFDPGRDANPFFHLVEAMWMLAGRDTLKDLTPYVRRMADYSDDGGVTQPGAYGKRWRDWFADVGGEGGTFPTLDQLDWVVRRLCKDSSDRRVVIQMWDAGVDPHRADQGSRDVPCNLTALPYVTGSYLNLTVFCRSNDVVWGAYGANAVHFSFMQEYLASRLGLSVGTYTQVSNNFHAYLKTVPTLVGGEDPYKHVSGFTSPDLFGGWRDRARSVDDCDRQFREDLAIFFEHGPYEAVTKARTPFIRKVLCPMALAHRHAKAGRIASAGRYEEAIEILHQCQGPDWHLAGVEWMERRRSLLTRAQDDGVQYEA